MRSRVASIMDFLHRRPWPDKPLPVLPKSAGAVENIPQRRSHPSAAGQIIRRVSNIFKKRPSALTLTRSNMGRIYESSQDSLTDDEDDIRRPSGLGSAASISSLPPSPFAPSYPSASLPYPMRSSSTPNLLCSYSAPRKDSPKPGFSLSSVPSETLTLIFTHLAKSDLAQVARTCRLFLSPARVLVYADVCLDTLPQVQLESLIAVLGSRRDLTDLVRTFSCETWPTFFLPTSGSSMWRSSSTFSDLQHHNTLLTATFTLAFQRMSNLTALTLPSYDHDLLAHHTAFCLQSITFTCSTLSKELAHDLFGWLDGQINIATLLFPKLVQDTDYGSLVEPTIRSTSLSFTSRPNTSHEPSTSTQGRKYLVAPFLVPLSTSPSRALTNPNSQPPHSTSQKSTQRPKSALPTSPSYATTTFAESLNPSRIPFPSSDHRSTHSSTTRLSHHKPHQHSIFSVTLLPNLTNLHAPPSLVIALASPPLSFPTDHSGRHRPLHSVHINITSTLYTGLRPATIMSKLIGVTRCLGLYFGENVDRRSVEKVLGAAGSSLGGVRQGFGGGFVDDSDGDEGRKRGKKEFKFGEGEWKGLIELDVSFTPGGPGSDEKLHKLISSAIPRYPYLRILRLRYLPTSSSSSSSSILAIHHNLNIPSPTSSMTPTTPPITPQQKSSSSNVYHPPSYRSTSTTSTMTSSMTNSKGASVSAIVVKDLSPPERAYIRQWSKYCRDLECVLFLDGAEWVKKG